jgi:hypothetical protein
VSKHVGAVKWIKCFNDLIMCDTSAYVGVWK